MKIIIRRLLDVVLYVATFLCIQMIVTIICGMIWKDAMNPKLLISASAIASVLTVAVFAWWKWYVPSRQYIRKRPWNVLTWVTVMSLGTIIPSEWVNETLHLELPQEYAALYASLMSSPWGYLAVGILVPIAEEVVFRGTVLRTLLDLTGRRWRWAAIVASALIFGACHGNSAQLLHAAFMGILIGWLYERTRSIVPGLLVHWVNNSIGYAVYTIMPNLHNADLLELCQGDQRKVALYVVCSLCLLLPAIFQLNIQLPRGKKEKEEVARMKAEQNS